jgi:tripartite-type tricarboxylate transporter receptor subunit TctC
MFVRILPALVVASLAFPAAAQNWPERPVKIVVPFTAGGPLDMTARLLGERLAEKYKQPFIIENRPGAAGNLGTEAVARAAPDGHTLLMVLDTPLTVNPSLYGNLPFDPEKDLAPISIVASFSQMLVVHPSVSAGSLAEFVAYAKSVPLTYGSGGANGNPGHLTMEYFRARAGFEATHVPYRGNPQVVADLVGGHIKAGFVAIPGVADLVNQGKLKGLAVSGSRRSPKAPSIPAVAEAGYAGLETSFYLVLLAPSGLPSAIRKSLEADVQEAISASEFRRKLEAQDLSPIGSSDTEAATRLKSVSAQWKALIKNANIRPE